MTEYGARISHDGKGDCPVSEDAPVEIERRDGSKNAGKAGLWHHYRDCFNSWKHNGGNCDIVAYREAEA